MKQLQTSSLYKTHGLINVWYYLPYTNPPKTLQPTVNNSTNSLYIFGTEDGSMGNSFYLVSELLSMIELGEGRVYTSGLGLGILPLLLANKPNVTEVVVSEINPVVIEYFLSQGFDLNKIKIIQEDWNDHDLQDYDWVLLEHDDKFPTSPHQIKTRGNILYYQWENHYLSYAKSQGYRAFSFPHYQEFCKQWGLPQLPREKAERYLFERFKQQTALEYLKKSLEEIQSRRT